jgi:hypothetical protein
MVDTPSFVEYKQYMKNLSAWLTSTNANVHEVLQSVNNQQTLLIVKVCKMRISSFLVYCAVTVL